MKAARGKSEEIRTQQQGREELARVKVEIDAMPPTVETIQKLRRMVQSNGYRLPQLSFSQQNDLYSYINAKIEPLTRQLADARCAPVMEKITVPAALEGAIIDDNVEQNSMVRFLCSAILATGKVSVRAGMDEDRYDVVIGDAVLTFELGRFLSQQRMFVGRQSPLPGGVKALRLVGARTPQGPLPVDRYLFVNLAAQFTPALSAYFSQLENAARRH